MARMVNGEILHKRFSTVQVNYKGVRFPFTGPTGDFEQSVRYYGAYEPLLMDRVADVVTDGMKILDVGAAEGYFSVFVSRLTNSDVDVVAFDADESRLRLFHRNTSRALQSSVKLVQSFVGDGHRPESPALDSLVLELGITRVDLIKLDVEGDEIFVLPGATNIIEEHRPHVFAEIHPEKIESADENGISKLLSWLGQIDMPIWLCSNHRGEHRGPVEPWRNVSVTELANFVRSGEWRAVGNFYIHLDPRVVHEDVAIAA